MTEFPKQQSVCEIKRTFFKISSMSADETSPDQENQIFIPCTNSPVDIDVINTKQISLPELKWINYDRIPEKMSLENSGETCMQCSSNSVKLMHSSQLIITFLSGSDTGMGWMYSVHARRFVRRKLYFFQNSLPLGTEY